MTAVVTTLQTALKAALDAIPTGDRPVPYTVRVQEADVAEVPAKGSPADIVIGFDSSARIARTSSSILEQHLIPVTIKRRYAEKDQAAIDDCHALEQLIRDTLGDYHSATERVDQLVTLHPFDIPSANSPGVYVARSVLDCDVLRRQVAITQDDTTPTQILSAVRGAVWDSLDNWSEWNGSTWGRKFRDDVDLDELALHDPAPFEFPALAVTWGPTSPRFLTNLAQDWPATLNVTAWFPAHQTTLAEYRAWQIVRAVWQCHAVGDQLSYVRRACGRLPEKNSPINLDPVELGRSGQVKALKLTVGFVITGISAPDNE